MTKYRIIVMAAATLTDRVLAAFDPGHLELIIMPTERCNFRCTYCYEDFKNGKMSRQVVEGIKLLLAARSGDLQSLELSWFGGEPLLAQDSIIEINNFAKVTYSAKKYSSSITTNGYYLNRSLFDDLVASGVRHFQVSLDGPREYHNRTRITAGGDGTFDSVWDNLVKTKESSENFAITLRVHLTDANVSSISALIDDIVTQFSNDGRYSIFVKEIVRLGGPGNDRITPISKVSASAAINEIKKRCAGLIEVQYDDEGGEHVCYASRLNSFLIRSDGSIGKCTVALRDTDNVVGLLGADGAINIDRDRLKIWVNGLFTGDRNQLGCPLAFKNKISAHQ